MKLSQLCRPARNQCILPAGGGQLPVQRSGSLEDQGEKKTFDKLNDIPQGLAGEPLLFRRQPASSGWDQAFIFQVL